MKLRIAIALVLTLFAVSCRAQGNGGSPSQQKTSGQGGPGGGFHLLPRFVVEKLNLTDSQQQQIADLEKDTKAKLDKILTPEQKKTLDEMRPPHPGQGDPSKNNEGQPNRQSPPRK
jgi:Spy/CpxP family protein refolding chaperone